ncbi:MAG: S-adenosylmethionine:tRNA ribosyltransferase-isomerase [Pseudohongiellaceae bacterium]|jgi:S-adenosylmethionine:tRNA ribosyltransferase-isomerase
MKVSDFDYHLPKRLIADFPTPVRSESRLLCLNPESGQTKHKVFNEITDLINPGDLLVFNDTRVIPARLFGQKESGGRFEALIERMRGDNQALAQIKLSKSAKPGTKLIFDDKSKLTAEKPRITAEVLGREGEFYVIQFPLDLDRGAALDQIGHIPLPPYIKRSDRFLDIERYQTVYAKNDGSVAAPTAGLHFDDELLAALDKKGIDRAFITLHVGAGTFQSIRAETVEEHEIHKEWIEIGDEACAKIKKCKDNGGRVIAVGTTSVRSLESCALNREFSAYTGETDIFIYPGFEFKIVDALITNFHLPSSSLVMLVSALSSKDILLNAYKEAIANNYRFYSYGDAMFISK